MNEKQIRMEVPDLGKKKTLDVHITSVQLSKANRGFIVRVDGYTTGMPDAPPGHQQPTAEVSVFEKKIDLEDFIKRLIDDI